VVKQHCGLVGKEEISEGSRKSCNELKFYSSTCMLTSYNSMRVYNGLIIITCQIFVTKISNLDDQEQNNIFKTYFSAIKLGYGNRIVLFRCTK
jgi:hypothetical protein